MNLSLNAPITTGTTVKGRLETLRELLSSGVAGTQEEIRSQLESKGFAVTQSTISRDLRRLGAIKAIDDQGRTIYKYSPQTSSPLARTSLSDLVLSIRSNGMLIVIRTTSGSAPLVAARIDNLRPGEILGTIAGDDTIFVAPASSEAIQTTIDEIKSALLS